MSTNPGSSRPPAQVDDLLVGWARRDLGDGAALADHAVLHQDARVLVGAQGAAGERALRGVEERARGKIVIGGHASARGVGTATVALEGAGRRSAATLTAMVAGSLPATSGSPMGVVIRASASGPWPSLGQLDAEPGPLGRRADQADRAEVRAAQRDVAQGGVLGVVVGHDEHVGARRAPRRGPARARGAWCTWTRATASRVAPAAPRRAAPRASRRGAARGRGGPGSGPARARRGRRPKIATDGTTASGSRRMVTSPPQHCTPCSTGALSLRDDASASRDAARLVGEHAPGPAATAVASRLPPPMLPHVGVGGDDHLRAGLARRVPAHRRPG